MSRRTRTPRSAAIAQTARIEGAQTFLVLNQQHCTAAGQIGLRGLGECPRGRKGVGGGRNALPRREHVEDDAVGPDAGIRQRLGEVAECEAPGGVLATEELGHVPAGDVGELLAALK